MIKALLLLLQGAKFGKLLLSAGTMLLSVFVYSWIFGWKYAAGFVFMILVHELGHYIAAKQRGLDVGLPTFIPFVGAWIELKEQPMDVETEAHVAFAGPLAGTLAAAAAYFYAADDGPRWLLAVAYAGFFLNLFNLVPLSPLDGGRIVAALSPKLWIVGAVILVGWMIRHPSPLLFLLLLLALPNLWKAVRTPDAATAAHEERYYRVATAKRVEIGVLYLGLALYLAWMTEHTHALLGAG